MNDKHLTDVDYWDRNWSERPVTGPLDPQARGLNGTPSRSLHRFFKRIFSKINVDAGNLIAEAGCGGSAILPYFHTEFGFQAEGIDNSSVGLNLSRTIARQSGIDTPVQMADVFNLPAELRERYDIVFSYGLAEHFRPTTLILKALSKLARPGGHVLTLVPNMSGALGLLQRLANPEVYAIHVPLTERDLALAHEQSDLKLIEAGYLMTANFSAINFQGANTIASQIGPRLASWTSKAFWILESAGMPEMPNRLTSPYVYALAQKPS
jgi:2-polyprenyl-3-methyl-5-hydroxy-6-metoxy-1,4-benzoquinol methylase